MLLKPQKRFKAGESRNVHWKPNKRIKYTNRLNIKQKGKRRDLNTKSGLSKEKGKKKQFCQSEIIKNNLVRDTQQFKAIIREQVYTKYIQKSSS